MNRIVVCALALLAFAVSVQATGLDISGKWHFVMDTPGGDREMDAVFHLDGEQVTGKWGTADIAGTFLDGKLNLAFPYTSEESGETETLKITGALKDDALTGTWEFGSYSGTYKATRAK